MAMTRLLIALATLVLAACATVGGRFDTVRITDVYVADFTSTAPAACTTADVGLSNDAAHAFFRRAKRMSEKALADNYPLAPCKIEGTLRYKGAPCDFEISAAMTGMVRCDAQRWFFACDDCRDLLGK
ncbi:hypothetical protein [Cognatazoarcus halotolerans]|uniref:hypothetical protein n=1 Tax=Cognatazoarcus halotolerans TaxID=2686016 RepID=UPI001357C453|nr:hypothetical protein [Cognatazoarcus halotolerans]MBX3678775.1 hypothetical protein [Rhodocyclaceae bacterium]MCB1901424.1 hypothetical protein [Rhodocyclaceae bacterium]MCP5309897.1 hypothetical protein [Zoogloeaceae bacterium]